MPAWVNTPEEEKAWKRAKAIVREQRGKPYSEFESSDWGLVTHIAKNILSSSVLKSSAESQILYKLSKVQHSLELRAAKKKSDQDLPDGTRELVSALKKVMARGGQAIAKLRKAEASGLEDDEAENLAERLLDVADQLDDLLKEF